MGVTGTLIARLGQISYGMGEMQLKEVSPQIFARLPKGDGGKIIQTNHAAFVYGHLAIYPSMLLGTMLGLDASKAQAPAGFDELFQNGKPCLDDPAGTIYPKMDVITGAFFSGYKAVLEALPSVPDTRFAMENPREPSRKRFPTVGDWVTFTLTGHMMMHLGQVSAWRRCWGLGSVM